MSRSSEPAAGQVLVDLFDRFDHGDNLWHAQISALLGDLSASQAAWRPSPERRSIWRILRHMIFWREFVLARLQGVEPPDPEAGDGTEPPSPDEKAWKADLARYREVHQKLREAVLPLEAEALLAGYGRRDLRMYHLVAGLLAH